MCVTPIEGRYGIDSGVHCALYGAARDARGGDIHAVIILDGHLPSTGSQEVPGPTPRHSDHLEPAMALPPSLDERHPNRPSTS